MRSRSIYNYIADSNEDAYAIEVFYYYLKKALATNNLSLHDCDSITFGKDYFLEPEKVTISKHVKGPVDSFALLLSVRALMLDSTLIRQFKDDDFLFKPILGDRFEWIKVCQLVTRFLSDDEFKGIFSILCHLYENKRISKEDTSWLCDSLVPPTSQLPFFKLQQEARESSGPFTKNVICDNAYTGDENLEEFDVPETIRYIGDTAFSFCSNLCVIRLFRSDIRFGDFPIVECDSLERIVVPSGSEDYYKTALPYYSDIIINAEEDSEDKEEEEDVDYDYLQTSISHVFDNVTTSYKFFWFKSIIDYYYGTIDPEDENLIITIDELTVSMCAEAWPIVMGNQMKLCPSDQLLKYFTKLQALYNIPNDLDMGGVYQTLYEHIEEVMGIISPLQKNVPYRFISPWIKYTSDADVIAKSQEDDYYGPYAVTGEKTIVVERHWAQYFLDNHTELSAFIFDELCKHLKKYNTEDKVEYFKKTYSF